MGLSGRPPHGAQSVRPFHNVNPEEGHFVSKIVDPIERARARHRCTRADERCRPPDRWRRIGRRNHEVAKSETGSYIVVMEADPLVVTEGQDALNTPKVQKKAKGLAKGHDKVLEDAGASSSDKVHSYTNALNGFSAVLSYDEAKEVAAQPGVASGHPDDHAPARHRLEPGLPGPRRTRPGLANRRRPVKASSSASSTPASGRSTRLRR